MGTLFKGSGEKWFELHMHGVIIGAGPGVGDEALLSFFAMQFGVYDKKFLIIFVV